MSYAELNIRHVELNRYAVVLLQFSFLSNQITS